jgi:hypothetical protein
MSDRGMKKWAPYASLIEQKGTIRRMKQSRNQSPKPLLSSDRAQELNETILMSLGQSIIVQWYEDGQVNECTTVVTKLDLDQKIMKTTHRTIVLSSIINIRLI